VRLTRADAMNMVGPKCSRLPGGRQSIRGAGKGLEQVLIQNPVGKSAQVLSQRLTAELPDPPVTTSVLLNDVL